MVRYWYHAYTPVSTLMASTDQYTWRSFFSVDTACAQMATAMPMNTGTASARNMRTDDALRSPNSRYRKTKNSTISNHRPTSRLIVPRAVMLARARSSNHMIISRLSISRQPAKTLPSPSVSTTKSLKNSRQNSTPIKILITLTLALWSAWPAGTA
ncbi:hypothetical protein D3C79_590700 [compost metagenome]